VFEDRAGKEVKTIAKDFGFFAESSYVWSILLGRRGFDPSRYWEVQGLEHLRAALEHGKGVILLTAHFGHAKWIPHIMEAHGFKARRVVVADPRGEKKHGIDQWLAAGGGLRRHLYDRTRVYEDPRQSTDIIASLDVRPILRALSDNEILVIAGDGVRATGFVQLPLLGQLYPFPTGFMKIAVISGAIVLPTFAFPGIRNMSIRTEIRRALAISPKKSTEENVRAYADTLNNQLLSTPHLWEHWSRINWFENARKWAVEGAEDPFTSAPPWVN
jgi:lauroyl/myristoyl acyltransferase